MTKQTPSTEINKWSDEFMFKAEDIKPEDGPKVHLLSANNDPLGSIAAAAKAYKGEFVASLAEITDDERVEYLREIQKTALGMPLEAVNFQFRITGVTRGFTHQMVRQRTAAYSQESTRFAVKEGVPVGLPPSLKDSEQRKVRAARLAEKYPFWEDHDVWELTQDPSREQDRWRDKWDEAVDKITEVYNYLVNDGMPAEDARGLLPTNLLTQINFHSSLRGLVDHAGLRLCTQAQYEWREVWAQIVIAIREYGKRQSYLTHVNGIATGHLFQFRENRLGIQSSEWQFDAIAEIFKPICYQKGACQFNASFDRKCSIKSRVDAFAANGVPSTEWEQGRTDLGIPAIRPDEYMADPAAAR